MCKVEYEELTVTQFGTVFSPAPTTTTTLADLNLDGELEYGLVSGEVPGLFLNQTTGQFYGTPTVVGTFVLTIRGQHRTTSTCSAGAEITIIVLPGLQAVASYPRVIYATVGAAPNLPLAVNMSGGQPPYSFSTLNAEGLTVEGSEPRIAGIPVRDGNETLRIFASDTLNATIELPDVLAIVALPLTLAGSPQLMTAQSYAERLPPVLEGGRTALGPMRYAVDEEASVGTLPPGVSLLPDGRLAGTPNSTVGGSYPVFIIAKDNNGAVIRFKLIIEVSPPLEVSGLSTLPSTLQKQQRLEEIDVVNVVGGLPPYQFALNPATAAAGLSINPQSGKISGAVFDDHVGSLNVSVIVTDANGASTSIDLGTVAVENAASSAASNSSDSDNKLRNVLIGSLISLIVVLLLIIILLVWNSRKKKPYDFNNIKGQLVEKNPRVDYVAPAVCSVGRRGTR